MKPHDEESFDDVLRRTFDGFAEEPAPALWQRLESQLPPARLPAGPPAVGGRYRPLRPFGAGLGLGALLAALVMLWPGRLTWPAEKTAKRTGDAPAVTTVQPFALNRGPSGRPGAGSTPPAALAWAGAPTPTPATATASAAGAAPMGAALLPAKGQPWERTTRTGTPNVASPKRPTPRPAGVFLTASKPVLPAPPHAERQLFAATKVAASKAGNKPGSAELAGDDTAEKSPTNSAQDIEIERLTNLVATQVRALGALRHEVDSLKAALPELMGSGPGNASAPASAAPDSLTALALPLPVDSSTGRRPEAFPAPRRWAALLTLDATGGWGQLPTADPATTRETTAASLSRGLQAERRFGPAQRWRVRAGVGETRLKSNVYYAADLHQTTVRFDSVVTFDLTVHQSIDTSLIIHLDSIPRLEPRLNANLQLIGYDTVGFISTNDTTYQVVASLDTLRATRLTVTRHEQVKKEHREQWLRPEYGFWTLPLATRYDLLIGPRWRLGALAGATVQIYRGGTVSTWTGERYALRRVKQREGPFRPVSLSLTAGLEVAYRLTPRLTATVAPTVRWWAVDPLKTGALPRRVLPTALLGLGYEF